MRISKRLQAVIDEVKGTALADIGTDHGYVPIESVRTGRVTHAYACDINPGPLHRAAANINACGLSDSIDLRQGYGLASVNPGEADCISIAGMGGMLMAAILYDGANVLNAADRLVLQPQLDISAVRRRVHELGFMITAERMVFEGKYYTSMRCEHGRDDAYTSAEYEYGRVLISSRDAVLREYLEKRIAVCERLLRAHENARLRRELTMCEGVLSCY